MRHFAATKLKLDTYLIAFIEEFFAVANFCEVIVVVDVYPKLDFLQLRPGRLFVLVVLGEVVAKFAERDNFAHRRICRGRDFDQIEAEALSFAQGI